VGNGGSKGAKPPWRGAVGGVPPQKLKKGRVTNPCNLPTSGTQNAGESSANEGGEGGVEGAQPPPLKFGLFEKGLEKGG